MNQYSIVAYLADGRVEPFTVACRAITDAFPEAKTQVAARWPGIRLLRLEVEPAS